MPPYQNWNMGLAKNQKFVSSTLTGGTLCVVCLRKAVGLQNQLRLVQLQHGTLICRYGVVVSTLVFQTGDTGSNPVTGFNKKFVIFKIFCYNNYRK